MIKSLREFPKMLNLRPLVIDKNNVVIGGNMRLKALKELGYEEVPVLSAEDLTPDEIKRFVVVDNLPFGQWDYDVLGADYGLDELEGMGFDTKEIGLDLGYDEKDDDVPDKPEAPVSVLGDVYILGKHKIVCGDSTNVDVVDSLMAGEKAAMVFTDPPYNVAYTGGTKDKLTIQNDSFEGEGFYDFIKNAMLAIRGHVTGDVYICMSSSELDVLQRAFREVGGHWSTFIIWVKNTFTLGRSNYQRQYEPILYGWFEGSSHYWSGVRNLGDVYKSSIKEDLDGVPLVRVEGLADGIESDIWDFDKPARNKQHPTMKPIDLIVRGVVNSSKPGDIVLDTFLGSGSTLIACEKTKRACYGIELDPAYIDVIVSRYCEHTGNYDIVRNGEQVTWTK